MGAVASACEGCFGAEKANPQNTPQSTKPGDNKHKYQELKHDTQQDTTDNKNPPESLKSSRTGALQKQNPNSSIRLPSKKTKGEDPSQDKNKKLTIKDFDLIKVRSFSNEY